MVKNETVKVFVSYAWAMEAKAETAVLTELEGLCHNRDIELIYDKKVMKHGESIRYFMEQIAESKHTLLLISDRYLHSRWCMYELMRIYQNANYRSHVSILIVDDCAICQNDDYHSELVGYWADQLSEAEARFPQGSSEFRHLQLYRQLNVHCPELIGFIADKNIPTLAEYRNKKFAGLLNSICPPRPEVVLDFHQKKLDSLIAKLSVLNVKSKDLLNKEFPEIVEVFREAQSQYANESLDRALLAALSAKYEQAPRFLSTPEPTKPYFTVPVARPHTTELLMSAESQRDPRLVKKSELNPAGKAIHKVMPDTKFNLASPPEFGIEGYDYKDVMQALLTASADERFVVARLFADYESDMTRTYDYPDKKRIAEKRLEREQGKYYWPVRVSDRNREAITAVYQALPLLKILNLNDSLDLDEEEQELFKAIATFIKD